MRMKRWLPVNLAWTWAGLSILAGLLLWPWPNRFPAALGQGDGTTVSIDVPTQVDEDVAFIARVKLPWIKDFDASQFDVSYDPSVLKVTDVTAGSIASTIIPLDLWGFVPVGTEGTIRVIANIPGTPGVDGSGYLAEIHFHAIGSKGSISFIDLHHGILGDKNAQKVTATWADGLVGIGAGSPLLGDADRDCDVDIFDLLSAGVAFNSAIGKARYNPHADFNRDGVITILDLVQVGIGFGKAC